MKQIPAGESVKEHNTYVEGRHLRYSSVQKGYMADHEGCSQEDVTHDGGDEAVKVRCCDLQ